MKREIKTTEFLRTGKFGSVEINDSLETVIEKLGEPDGTHNPEVVKPKNGRCCFQTISWNPFKMIILILNIRK